MTRVATGIPRLILAALGFARDDISEGLAALGFTRDDMSEGLAALVFARDDMLQGPSGSEFAGEKLICVGRVGELHLLRVVQHLAALARAQRGDAQDHRLIERGAVLERRARLRL